MFLGDLWQIGLRMSSTRKGKGLYPSALIRVSLGLAVIRRATLVSGPGSVYYQRNTAYSGITCFAQAN